MNPGGKPHKTRFRAIDSKKRPQEYENEPEQEQSIRDFPMTPQPRVGSSQDHHMDIPSEGEGQKETSHANGRGKSEEAELGEGKKRDEERQNNGHRPLPPVNNRLNVAHVLGSLELDAHSDGIN